MDKGSNKYMNQQQKSHSQRKENSLSYFNYEVQSLTIEARFTLNSGQWLELNERINLL